MHVRIRIHCVRPSGNIPSPFSLPPHTDANTTRLDILKTFRAAKTGDVELKTESFMVCELEKWSVGYV